MIIVGLLLVKEYIYVELGVHTCIVDSVSYIMVPRRMWL
jgi:hypothetical protein